MFYFEWHLAHRLVSPLDSCLIIRSDNENISIPRLFTAMPCEVAESHMSYCILIEYCCFTYEVNKKRASICGKIKVSNLK